MVQPITARNSADAGVISDRPQSRSAIAFVAGLVLAALLTVIATLLLLSGEGLAGHATPAVQALLAVSLVISMGLAGIAAHRVQRVVRAWRSAATGAQLHLRFATLFGLAALAPALIVAAYLGFTFSQGVERWFSQRVETTTENAAAVGKAYVDFTSDEVSGETLAMAADLNRVAHGITDDPAMYRAYLNAQMQARLFSSAYVVRRNGEVMARAEQADARAYARPTPQALATADEGSVSISYDQDNDRIVAVYKLAGYRGGDAYLTITRGIEPGLVRQLRQLDQAVDDYRRARESQGQLRLMFGLAYGSAALLMLLGAIWVGLSSATRVAEPIGRLVGAARRVAAGDLKARVPIGDERDEVDALAGAFNRMTAQLETQRRDLVTAQEDAENRRRFIETVLGGVSAGVVGLDRDGRISAANRSAAQLLSHEHLVGRRMIDVAPEFADLLNQPVPHGETPPQRVDLMREGGSVNLSVRMSPDAEGGLVLTFDDMTKLISAQRQEAWKDVARRIAHEIKNPLTPIQLSAERLQRKYAGEVNSDPETFQRCTETILRQVADIGRMVDEFSAFARMPTPRMGFADMSEIARSTVFGQRLAFPDIRVEVEGASVPIGLVCDERLIAQALTNLVKNAAESVLARRARDGEPKEGFVLLKLRDLDYGVQFEVIDNGLGFPEKDRNRLIEPYVTTRTKGAGLGLAIVARVVEDHGGLIELDDAPGKAPGAVVRFVLPKRGEEPSETALAVQEPSNGV